MSQPCCLQFGESGSVIRDMEEKYSMQWIQDEAKPPLGGAWVLPQKTMGMSRAKDES